MDASEQITILANAISEGVNHLAYLRALRAAPPVASLEDLQMWRKALEELQTSLKSFQEGYIEGHVLASPSPVSSALILCIENVCARLSTLGPGARLPSIFFDEVDVAWTELENHLSSQQ